MRAFMARRPNDRVLASTYRLQVAFWKALMGAVPSVKEALTAPESSRACAQYRHAAGGHILFRPVGQRHLPGQCGCFSPVVTQ